jgi:hypothetical protein
MSISGHSDTRMLALYTHSTESRKLDALESFAVGTGRAHSGDSPADGGNVAGEIAELLRKVGGRREDRTRDLRIANAALSQLS